MSFEQFMAENGWRLQRAKDKMDCLARTVEAFWAQRAVDPDVMDTNLEAMDCAHLQWLEGRKELQLFKIELKKFYGLVRDEPNISAEEDEEPDGKPVLAPPPRFPFVGK